MFSKISLLIPILLGNMAIAAVPLSKLHSSGKDAFYEHALQQESLWRAAVRRGVAHAPELMHSRWQEQLLAFNNSVARYLYFFPEDRRLIGLLLRAASASAGGGQVEVALKFWHHVLASPHSTVNEQISSVRGLVYTHLAQQNYSEALEMLSHFLHQNRWGKELRQELAQLLSRSVLNAGQRLTQQGEVDAAAQLLQEYYDDFSELPGRAQLLLNSGYYYAVAENWLQAKAIAQQYLAHGYPQEREQMLYLLAKAHDKLAARKDAIASYFKLYESYPQHVLASYSFDHIVSLATEEKNAKLLAQIFDMAGDREEDAKQRVDFYLQSFDNALASKQMQLAEKALQKVDVAVADTALRVRVLISTGKFALLHANIEQGVAKLQQALQLSKRIRATRKYHRQQLRAEINGLLTQIRPFVGMDSASLLNKPH